MVFKTWFYALKMAWVYRRDLSEICHNKNHQTASLVDLNPSALQASGIKALALDFDGVLASHGAIAPTAASLAWLKEARKVFGEKRIFILSNLQKEDRLKYFKQELPDIIWIKARKKPFPEGIHQILQGSTLTSSPKSLLVIDDRLLTGILAGLIAGVSVCWVVKPDIDLQKRPLVESFFMALRAIEKALF